MGDYRDITVDITRLEFLNCSGIRCMLNFIMSCLNSTKIMIKTDTKKIWQANAVGAIQSVDPDNIKIEEI